MDLRRKWLGASHMIIILLTLVIMLSFLSWLLVFVASLFVTEDIRVSWQEFNPKELIKYIKNKS
jgi:flagellar biosynthesis protein FlhB